MAKSNPSNFYKKISKKNEEISNKLKEVLESGEVEVSPVMTHYFYSHWDGFKTFWKESDETIAWMDFALAPHNAIYFIQWVFHTQPDVLEKVEADLIRLGWMGEENGTGNQAHPQTS